MQEECGLAANKKTWDLEKQNLQLHTDNAKKEAKSNETLAKDIKKEANVVKKELLQCQKELAKERDVSNSLGQRVDDLDLEKKELTAAKKLIGTETEAI